MPAIAVGAITIATHSVPLTIMRVILVPGKPAKRAVKASTPRTMWIWQNAYNFEKLQNPPSYQPTKCAECGKVIIRAHGGYSMVPNKGYDCGTCALKGIL